MIAVYLLVFGFGIHDFVIFTCIYRTFKMDAATEAIKSSRIFVRGLPPNITEADLKKHFSGNKGEVTDIKIIPQRRIGYVGFKNSDQAEGAVKYFNRSYLRMSKLGVELAKPVC